MIENSIKKLVEKRNLEKAEAFEAMSEILGGAVSPVQMAAFLTALKLKGETYGEISAFAEALRSMSRGIQLTGENLVDTCGTGGDEKNTFNISTTAAFIAAGAGVKVAKHGNRSVSSKCGSADVLEALGANLDGSTEKAERSLRETGFVFLFAPNHHQAIRHAMPVRKELGYKTVFNILGPLANPAAAKRQLIGVYNPQLVGIIGKVLLELGVEHGMVVHGMDGLDEISAAGSTCVAEVRNGKITEYKISPEDFGFRSCEPEELSGGDAAENANLLRRVLGGKERARQTAAILNGGAAIYLGGLSTDLKGGIRKAEESLLSGSAQSVLDRYIEINRKAVG